MIWKCRALEKVRFFLWLAARESLPSNQRRQRCNLTPSAACGRCGALVEDVDHILRSCSVAQQVWNLYRALLPSSPAGLAFRPWLVSQLQHVDHALACAVLWNLWTWRNNAVFEPNPWTLPVVLRKIHNAVIEFQRWGRMNGTQGMPIHRLRVKKWVVWNCVRTGA